MYRILIVDDEKIERDGLRYLIEFHKLPLQIAEAANGKKALEYLSDHQIDILITDIKMPSMDGLSLAEAVKEMNPEVKIIIFSAYGEFEYAKKAIHLSVVHYILKPAIISEFLDVFHKVIKLCEEDRLKRKQEKALLESYRKYKGYEKEKLLLDMIHTQVLDFHLIRERMLDLELEYILEDIVLLLVDIESRFFESYHDLFKKRLNQMVQSKYEFININECQSVIFLKFDDQYEDPSILQELGQSLIKFVSGISTSLVTIVISNRVSGIDEIQAEYERLEHVADFRFFYHESVILPADRYLSDPKEFNVQADRFMHKINKDILAGHFFEIEADFSGYFNSLKGSEGVSTLYVKYICLDLIRKVYETAGKVNASEFQAIAESIFKTSHLQDLKELVISYLSRVREEHIKGIPSDKQNIKKVIADILSMIHQQYSQDIGLESIAKSVFLSPGYLSGLFKKETGQSLVKYITLYRIERAKELLLNTNMKINEISQSVGFHNHSYFGMVFKNYIGKNPIQFREEGSGH